ncbi:hypothetical protein KC345_g2308 [Hortaea werneckii]|nr:hypothetical protein KC345_g2308 [Hortaea werneckii]
MAPKRSNAGGALTKGSANKTAEAGETVKRRSKRNKTPPTTSKKVKPNAEMDKTKDSASKGNQEAKKPRSSRANKATKKPDDPKPPESDAKKHDRSSEEKDDKSKKAAKGVQGPRELRPKKPATEEEIEGPKKMKYFKGHEKYYDFPQPKGPSIYFNSSEFRKGGAQAVFSNFHLASFYVGSTYYHSAEHYYQDQKASMIEKDGGRRSSLLLRSGSRGPVLPSDLNAANLRLYLHSVTAGTSHSTATRAFVLDGELAKAWEGQKPLALLRAVRHKFFKCPEERKYLLGTGDRELVEASSDKKCGVGCQPENAEKLRSEWGKNMLGMALMHVRHELRQALAKDGSCFEDQDAKVGVHHLEFKKPSVAFQIGVFDVPGMPTCEEQHQQAMADIRKEMASRVNDTERAADKNPGDELKSIHTESSCKDSSESTETVTGPAVVSTDAVNADASYPQGNVPNKDIIKMPWGGLLNTNLDVTETELAEVKDIIGQFVAHY